MPRPGVALAGMSRLTLSITLGKGCYASTLLEQIFCSTPEARSRMTRTRRKDRREALIIHDDGVHSPGPRPWLSTRPNAENSGDCT